MYIEKKNKTGWVVCLFELMLCVPSQQLRSCWDVVSMFWDFKPQKAYTYGWFDLNQVSWAGSGQSG